MTLTVEQILAGTRLGRMQTVGQMQVIPILGEDDDTFAPPDVETSSPDYGRVNVTNDAPRPTILPHGAAWIVGQQVQDHAIPSGMLVKARSRKGVSTAMCVEENQGGHIKKGKYELQILPAELRAQALAVREEQEFSRLWGNIREFNQSYGLDTNGGHIVYFLKQFEKELDEFVAEFELVPDQVGAIILIGGEIVGVERAPSSSFWDALWKPLVRVCYGSLAMKLSKKLGNKVPKTRVLLNVTEPTLDGIAAALARTLEDETVVINQALGDAARNALHPADKPDDALDRNKIQLTTVASTKLAGQIVTVSGRAGGPKTIKFASLSAARV